VVLGDINPGAQIVAGGNVVILGCLKGAVYAGYPDNKSTFVAALLMEPMQIQIGPCIARSPDHAKTKKGRILKKKDPKQLEARMAFVENDNIFIETITRSLINEISIN
jgi:septum site-determining protein MinC